MQLVVQANEPIRGFTNVADRRHSEKSPIDDIVILSPIGDMQIRTASELGGLLRERRRALDLSQAALAERVGTSRQWIVDLERGKPRLEIGLVLRAIHALGLETRITPQGAPTRPPRRSLALPSIDIDAIVDRARRRQ